MILRKMENFVFVDFYVSEKKNFGSGNGFDL